MKRVQASLVAIVGGFLLLHATGARSTTTCIARPPLKPVHRICGIVFFPSGDRVSNAKVMVLRAGAEIAEQQTGDDGKFSFDQLKAGKYEIQVRVNGLGGASTQVVLVQPYVRPKREIAVNISLSGVCWTFPWSILNN